MLVPMDMANRSTLISEEQLSGLHSNHPYLLIFQKEDWKEYLSLIAQIYDLLEADSHGVPFEVVKSHSIKFYSHRKHPSVESKVTAFFNMSIGELAVLKDSHDHSGQRFIEATRAGKELLQLVEGLILQRTKFTGTSAETLLGSLNNIVFSRAQMTMDEALSHHRNKIKAYQTDIKKIETQGLAHAELLPIPHSNEALFNQAEEAAIYLLSSIEDVKMAIEKNRQELSMSYFEKSKSAGQNLSAVTDFYESLYRSSECISYNQAKEILSFLDGYSSRFANKNVNQLVHKIERDKIIDEELINRSHLKTFLTQFKNADNSIQDKIKSQIHILQQQVHYALSTDIAGLQSSLKELVSLYLDNSQTSFEYLSIEPIEIKIPVELETPRLNLFEFKVDDLFLDQSFNESHLSQSEHEALIDALLQVEETTLQNIVEKTRDLIRKNKKISMMEHDYSYGLAEYYVLTEIELFAPELTKDYGSNANLVCKGKDREYILKEVPCYMIQTQKEYLSNGK